MTKGDYLRQVEWQLRDLPWRRRQQLIADLRAHLEEVPLDQLDRPRPMRRSCESAGLGRPRGPIAYVQARRPRNLAVVAVLLVLVALLASGFAWVQSYQPLATGSYGLSPSGSLTGATGETVVTFRDGRPFRFGFSVRNDGGFAVRVLGVPLTGINPFSTRLFVSRSLTRAHTIPGPTTPFRPFDLEPGEERMLILRGVYAHCRDFAGETQTESRSFPVRFSFLWRTETATLVISDPLVIRVPAGRRCAA